MTNDEMTSLRFEEAPDGAVGVIPSFGYHGKQ
jgi:hypothetical protein